MKLHYVLCSDNPLVGKTSGQTKVWSLSGDEDKAREGFFQNAMVPAKLMEPVAFAFGYAIESCALIFAPAKPGKNIPQPAPVKVVFE